MADINSKMYKSDASARHAYHRHGEGFEPDGDEMMAFAELFFFAYREFTGEPDSVLMEYGFGRAHHRVLHFVCRHPGLRVADLLDILDITKQSLARVLKQLVDQGFVSQIEGPNDRRERRLHLTDEGLELANKLSDFQRRRLSNALAELGPDGIEKVKEFLLFMVPDEERPKVVELISSHELPDNWKKREARKVP